MYLFDNVPLPALPASAAGAACDYFCMEPRADGGYFSDDSDDDVVRARLRTLGVQEHRIHFETGSLFSF